MNDCDDILLVQAEFDGELDAAEAAAAMRHRETCAVCREAYATLEATRTLMRRVERFAAPETLRRAVANAPAAKPVVPMRTRSWWRDGANFLAGAAVAAAIALLVLTPAQQSLIDQIVDGHVRALQPGHLEDVVSTDQLALARLYQLGFVAAQGHQEVDGGGGVVAMFGDGVRVHARPSRALAR